MLKTRKAQLIALCVCALILLAVLSLFEPIYGDICRYNEYSEHTRCTPNHLLFVGFWYVGRFFDSISAFATAAATVGLVGVTYLLVRLGQDQAKTSKAQLRAYLSVVIAEALFQDASVNFEGLPEIRNNGQTPAYKVRTWIVATVIGKKLIDTYDFGAAAPENWGDSQASIGPTEMRVLRAVVSERVPDDHVEAIKIGDEAALWVWGVVHYEDAFGDPHYVNFSQRIFWLPDGTMRGQYGNRFVGSD